MSHIGGSDENWPEGRWLDASGLLLLVQKTATRHYHNVRPWRGGFLHGVHNGAIYYHVAVMKRGVSKQSPTFGNLVFSSSDPPLGGINKASAETNSDIKVYDG